MDTVSFEKLEKLDNARTEVLQQKRDTEQTAPTNLTNKPSSPSSKTESIIDLTSEAVNRANNEKGGQSNQTEIFMNVSERQTSKKEDTLLDFSDSKESTVPSFQTLSSNNLSAKNPEVKLVSPNSEINLINLDISQKPATIHRSKSADRISDLVNQSPVSSTDPFSSFFDSRIPTRTTSSDSFDPFAPNVNSSQPTPQNTESPSPGIVQLDAFDPFSQNASKNISGKDDLISISPKAKESPAMFNFTPQQAPNAQTQQTQSPKNIIFDPFGATGNTNQHHRAEILQPRSAISQPSLKSQKKETGNKKQDFSSNLESLAQGQFDLNLNQSKNANSKQPMAASKVTQQKSPTANQPVGQKPSYIIGSREERGLRGSGGKPLYNIHILCWSLMMKFI